MKITLRLILILTVFLTFSNAKACDVINGSDITFIHMGGYKYHVRFILYHQCVCKLGIMPKFTISCAGTSLTIVPPRTSIRDITPVCSNGQPPCANGGYGGTRFGIEEHIFEDTIDFAVSPYNQFLNNNCCELMFRVAQPWGLVGTTTSTTSYGGEAMMNICAIGKKGNTTPTISTIPMSFMCCNQPFTFNNGIYDIKDNDSLSYALDEPLSATWMPVSWNSPLNKDIPLTPYCPPNPGTVNCRALPNAKPPRGFYFDKETGDMVFTPVKCDESGPIAIKVTEFRKDSITKKMVKIGFTRRDIYVTVVTCSDNNPPYIEGNNKHSVCEGNKICFTITGKDDPFLPKQTVPDTVYMTWNNGIPGASFTILDPTAREKEAEFCWTPRIGDARNQAYSFAVTAKDDACPRPAYTIKGFNVKVNPKARDTRKYDILECGKMRFTAFPSDTVNFNKNNYRYKFVIRDSTNSGVPYYTGFSSKDSIYFKRGGKFIITHEINNPPYNCPTTYIDTIIMPPVLDVQLAFGKDTFVCAGNNITLEPAIANGVPTYKYKWEAPQGTQNPKDTFNKFTLVKPTSTTKVILKLTDGKKCVDYDTIVVKYQPNPIVNIGPDQRICTYNTVILDAQNDDTMRYYWLPNGDSTRTIEVNIAGKYIAKVIDHLGCNTSDTMSLFVNDTVTAIAKPNKEICIQDTLKVKGMRRPLGYSRQISWRDVATGVAMASDSAFSVKINSLNLREYEMTLKVNQSNVTCEDKDTLVVFVNDLPSFSFKPLPPRCYADGAVNLTLNEIATAKSGDKTVTATPAQVRYYQQFKKPSWVTGGPIEVNTFVYDFPKFIENKDVPQTGLRDTICYEYKDYKGCVNRECKPIRLNSNPTVQLTPDRTFCQQAGPIALDQLVEKPFSKVGGIQTFRIIDVPAGSGVDPNTLLYIDYSTVPNKTICPIGEEGENEKTGTYEVEYCYKDALTGCQTCDSVFFHVIRLPEIQFTEVPKICINFPQFALDSLAQDRNTGMRFTFGFWETLEFAGSRDINNPNIGPKILNSILPDKKTFDPKFGAGRYLVKLTDTSSGCPVTDSIELLVNGLPNIQIVVPDTVCSSSAPFTLNNVLPNGAVGTWSGTGVTGREFDPSFSPKSKQYEGPTKVRFDYTNPITGCSASDSQTLLIQSQPELSVSSPNPYQQCEGKDFNLVATKKFASRTLWTKNGDGDFSADDQLSTIYNHGFNDTAVSGLNGNVRLTISTRPEGVCPVAKVDVDLIIEPFPQFSFLADPEIQCEPATINFNSTVAKPANTSKLLYTWDYGNGQSLSKSTNAAPQSIVYDTAKRTWYDVSLTVDNQWGTNPDQVCTIRKDSIGYIKVLPQPDVEFSSDPGFFTTVAFPKFKFFNETYIRWSYPGNLEYLWHFGTDDIDDTSKSVHPIKHYTADTAKYRVHLTAEYSFMYKGILETCIDTIGQLRKIEPDVTVFVPTAFSPEGTGPKANNVFKAVVNGEKTFEMQILNRWGELMWQSTDKNAFWDGSYKGEDAMQDVYIWVIKVSAFDGEIYTYEGTITLLR